MDSLEKYTAEELIALLKENITSYEQSASIQIELLEEVMKLRKFIEEIKSEIIKRDQAK